MDEAAVNEYIQMYDHNTPDPQMVLDDSVRIRATLDGFMPSLQDISAVCDTDALEERLAQTDVQVDAMQRRVLLPLDQLLHVSAVRLLRLARMATQTD